jgi:non-specific serine/threonine protein kinase
LTHGSRGAPTRQQTLWWCIGWSYELCSPVEQRLWQRLSVFAGSFDFDAAEEVCGTDLTRLEFLDALSALVDKSVVMREDVAGAVRFRMLGIIQDYGRAEIEDTGEYPELCRRHQQWCQRLVLEAEAEWISPRQLAWIVRFEQELPNIRKALDYDPPGSIERRASIAGAMYAFWVACGRLGEGRRWCDRVLGAAAAAPSESYARVLYASCVLAATQFDPVAASRYAADLRAVADQVADPTTATLAAVGEGFTALVSGDPARAAALLEVAGEALAEGDEPVVQVAVLEMLGWAYELQGATDRALGYYEKMLTVVESHDEKVFRSYGLWSMGIAVWRQGEQDRAEQLLQDGLRLARLVDDPFAAATCLEALAWVAGGRRDARRAAVMSGAADALSRAAGSTSAVVFPNLLVHHEECERRAHDMLGTRGYEAAHRKGAAMGFRAAVDFALGESPATTARADDLLVPLTEREQQVAELIAEGLSNKEIGARLVISARTARGHVEHILTKLGFTSRAQIAAWMVEHNPDDAT